MSESEFAATQCVQRVVRVGASHTGGERQMSLGTAPHCTALHCTAGIVSQTLFVHIAFIQKQSLDLHSILSDAVIDRLSTVKKGYWPPLIIIGYVTYAPLSGVYECPWYKPDTHTGAADLRSLHDLIYMFLAFSCD